MDATLFSGTKMHMYKMNVMEGLQLEGSQGESLRTNLLSVGPVETTALANRVATDSQPKRDINNFFVGNPPLLSFFPTPSSEGHVSGREG